MLTESGSGVLLQSFVNQYDVLPLILPVTASLAGNVGCVYGSRLSTALQVKGTDHDAASTYLNSQDNLIVMGTLFLISLPIHLSFLGFINLLGAFKFGFAFLVVYLIIGAMSVRFEACVECADCTLDCIFPRIGILRISALLE